MVRTGAALAAFLLLPLTAYAQPAPPPPTGGGAGSEVELDEDPPASTTESGAEENPDAPKLGDEPVVEGPQAPKRKPTGYPVNEVLRPITLPGFTSEGRFDVRIYPKEFDAEIGVRARYGITRQAQIGVRYAIGGFYDDSALGNGDVRFNTGKTVALDFQYLIMDWIAPRMTVPMYVDPFAIGMTLGAALKFRLGDKLALVGFEDLVGFKLSDKFVPDIDSERANEAAARELVTNEITSDGYLRFDFGAIYQATPELALTGRFGVKFDDFRDDDAGSSLRVQAQFTPKPMVDLIGGLGFDRLDETATVNLSFAVQVRI